MSRLKIDMVFKPLPSRRSVGKSAETSNMDKKSGVDKTNSNNSDRKSIGSGRAQKFLNSLRTEKKSVVESKNNLSANDSKAPNKNEKTKDDKKSNSKEDTSEDKSEFSQSQQLISTRRRLIEVNVVNNEDMVKLIGQDKESIKRVTNTKTLGKSTARKSLTSKEPIVVYRKKIEVPDDTQEEIDIEDVSTPMDSVEMTSSTASPVKSPVKTTSRSTSKSPIDKTSSSESDLTTSESELKSSQESDADIVESSQEPSGNSKLDKVEPCFITIKKLEVPQVFHFI